MMIKPNMILTVFAMALFFSLIACDDADISKKQSSNEEMSKKISIPVAPKKTIKPKEAQKNEAPRPEIEPEQKETAPVLADTPPEPATDHYNATGKIDPFIPLIQEKSESSASVIDDRPKRILTPLEKIDLSQIKLVAIISMKNRKIAMVEEANGKGYEVGIGTYIGKNQGRVFEITDSSIVVKEISRDFKGQLKENVQEIKIHKNDSEE